MSLVPYIKDNDWRGVRQAVSKLASIKLGGGSSPVFSGITLSGLTQGSVLFAGSGGVISQDNSNLFWDDSNNRLGVGINSPAEALDLGSGNLKLTGAILGGGAGHDQFSDFVANEHIDWTSATDDFNTSGKIFSGNGTEISPSISFEGDTQSGFYRPGGANIALSINGNKIVNYSTTQVDFTDLNLTTTGDGTFDELTITNPTQDYKFGGRSSALTLQSQTSGANFALEFYSKDGVGADYVFYTL